MKLVSLLLVLAMLLSFAACTTDPVDPVDSGNDSTADSTTPEDTTTVESDAVHTGDVKYALADYLPQETFDGEDIHIWVDGGDAFYNYLEEQLIEGDLVQAAVVERNASVEDTYDVVLNWNRDWTKYRDLGTIRQSILAGDEYDLMTGPAVNLNPQIVYGCYVDLATCEYIDFAQPWWIADATKNNAVFDKQYTAVGYFDFPTIGRIQVYYFNANMVEDYSLGNLYDLVDSGEWTWEKLLEMSETVSEDVNQDGVYDESDIYGFSSRWDNWICEQAAAGYQYISRDENGEYVITGVNDDLLELSEKIYPFITGSNMYFSRYTYGVHPSYPAEVDAAGKNMFANDQILFMLEGLSWTGSDLLRDFGAYGILPSPKYLDDQEDYGTASSCYVSAICANTGDLKISSIILEALQMESYNILRPAYINEALSYKYLTDPQAIETLNLIFRQMSTDWSYNFANAGIGTQLCFALPTQKYLSSFFQSNTAVMQQKLSDFLANVDAME